LLLSDAQLEKYNTDIFVFIFYVHMRFHDDNGAEQVREDMTVRDTIAESNISFLAIRQYFVLTEA